MNPRLTIIGGPLKGTVFSLAEDEVSIGRESTNSLCIGDSSVSRRHCVIRKDDDAFRLVDLESLNRTYVNDASVTERTLEHGDRLKIGDSLLLFHLTDDSGTPVSGTRIQFHERMSASNDTVRVRVADGFDLMARDLTALMKISTTINSIHSLKELEQQLLELIFEVVPAERGAILLVDEDTGELGGVFGLDREGGPDPEILVSRTITKQVMSDGVAMLSNELQDSDAFSNVQSVISTQLHSVLAVPLVLYEEILGVIYLYTTDPIARFDSDQLQLVTAIANIAAVALSNARHIHSLETENERLRASGAIEHDMIGDSERMKSVYSVIARVAPTDSTVLIRGESGTGKELAARAIHNNSPRVGKPFVAINCAALTETLLESEMFGYDRGAFTGAVGAKKGKLEVADGGTVFLDEIGELAPSLQGKLLRVLQERDFERLGGLRSIKVDLRIIAATNKDLEDAIERGTFRQDLYYRLNVVSLVMPALRDRRDDIPKLADFFAAIYSRKCRRKPMRVSKEAIAHLVSYDWPGNIRELENAIERAVVLGSTETILPDDLPEAVLETAPPAGEPTTKYHEAVHETKKRLILGALEQSGGSYTEAAKLLGVHPNYLHRLVRNMNLKAEVKKS